MIPNPVGTLSGAGRETHAMEKEKRSSNAAAGNNVDASAFEFRRGAGHHKSVRESLRSINERLSLLEMDQTIQMENAHHDRTRISRCEAALGIDSKTKNNDHHDDQTKDDELPF
jgi:hypothetical protein